jgi:hypothetical protein
LRRFRRQVAPLPLAETRRLLEELDCRHIPRKPVSSFACSISTIRCTSPGDSG